MSDRQRLVPREPTEAMQEAGRREFFVDDSLGLKRREMLLAVRKMYRAMVDAAPPAGHDTAEPVAWTTPEMDAVLWIDGPPIPPYTVPLYTHPPEVVRPREALQKINDTAMSHPYAGVTCGEIARAALAQTKGNSDEA